MLIIKGKIDNYKDLNGQGRFRYNIYKIFKPFGDKPHKHPEAIIIYLDSYLLKNIYAPVIFQNRINLKLVQYFSFL